MKNIISKLTGKKALTIVTVIACTGNEICVGGPQIALLIMTVNIK